MSVQPSEIKTPPDIRSNHRYEHDYKPILKVMISVKKSTHQKLLPVRPFLIAVVPMLHRGVKAAEGLPPEESDAESQRRRYLIRRQRDFKQH